MYKRSSYLIVSALILCLVTNATADPGLLGQWDFNGDFNDSSEYSNNGVAVGDAAVGFGLALDGDGDAVEVPNEAHFDITGPFTLMASVKTTADGYQAVINKGDGTSGYGLAIDASNRVYGYVVTDAGTFTSSVTQSVETGEWCHMAFIYDGVQLRCYYEGLDDTYSYVPVTGSIVTNDANVLIGNNAAEQDFDGSISNVQIYNRALSAVEICCPPPPETPSGPVPGHEAEEVASNVVLRWSPGGHAISHDVYFGTDFNDVNDGVTGTFKGNQPDTRYPAVGTLNLELEQIYYWRINEQPTAISGLVWKFTVSSFLVMEDFESYTDSSNLQSTWIPEGDAVPSFIYLSKLLTGGRAHLGSQSMRNNYYNTVGDGYCGAYIDFGAGLQDLTANGLAAISLYFSGKTTNTITANDALYITLEDNDSNVATVYRDGDVNDVKLTTWQEWAVASQDFVDINADLNLTEIKKISIGIGKGGVGGSGDVYFDDVRLYKSRCINQPTIQQGNLDNDCDIDFDDVAILASQWLQPPGTPSADIAPLPTVDGKINMLDFTALADNWRESGMWP